MVINQPPYTLRPLTWDGNVYDSVPGLANFNGTIYSFAEFNNKLYCGGNFWDPALNSGVGNIPNTKNIACFNGTTIEALDNVTPSTLVKVLKTKDFLYLAGSFYFLGSTVYGCVAGYNGTSYLHLGVGVQGTNPQVSDMTVYNNEIIICGDFSWVGGVYVKGIAAWNGTAWDNLKNEVNGGIYCLTVDTINNFLYAGTYFTSFSDGTPVSEVIRWNGFYWEDTDLPFLGNTLPSHLCMYHKELYASIYPRLVSLGDTINIWATDTILMRYDGNNWFNIPGLNSDILDMCVYNDDLYIGGGFTMAGTDSVNGIVALHVEPPTDCNWLMPRTFTNADTLYLNGGHAPVQFYNNNAYAQSWLWIFGDGATATVKDPLHDYTQTGTYTATVIVTEDGCVKTAQKTITVLMGNGIEEYSKEKLNFKLYPNPTSGELTIEVTIPPNKIAEIRLYSNYGSLQEKYSLNPGQNTLKIETKKYPAGIGLCSLFIEGKQVITEKVVIQK
jgi:hypothetical protein